MTNREIVEQIMKAIELGETKKIAPLIAPEFKTHQLRVPENREGFLGFIVGIKKLREEREKQKKVLPSLQVARIIEDGNLVVVHSRLANFYDDKTYINFDVFRLNNGLVLEHWDNIIEEMPVNPSGRSQIDGTTIITDREKTEQNKQLVRDSYKMLMHSKDNLLNKAVYKAWPLFRPIALHATKKFMHPNYMQHSPMIPGDTPEVVLDYYADEGQDGRILEIKKIHHVIGEGNFVLVTSETMWGISPTTHYDLYRVEDNKIIEHWDVVEPVLTGPEVINKLGKW